MSPSSRILDLLRHLHPRPLVLAHHYQRDAIASLADHRGDSLELARYAAAEGVGRDIIFCGVHFMAETADILTPPETRVFLPDPGAGCPLAEMADLPGVEQAWERLRALGLHAAVPITYINSSAALKAFCGRHGGLVCTSSNAHAAISEGFYRGEPVFFFPDQHLGENTALAMGIEPDRIVRWDPEDRTEAYTERLLAAQVVLWPGFCPIHRQFRVEDIAHVRTRLPGCRVIVHPECAREVVQAADLSGSTGRIMREVLSSPAGSSWGVGTEIHMVRRLAREAAAGGRTVAALRVDAACPNMGKSTPEKLLALLRALREGNPPEPVRVDPVVAADARLALDRMMKLQ